MRSSAAKAIVETVRHLTAGLIHGAITAEAAGAGISETLQQHFQVARVSLWCLQREADTPDAPLILRCACLHTAAQGRQTPPPPLRQPEFNDYLECLRREGVYASPEVLNDPCLNGLVPYFERHDIRSLMDGAFRINGRARGVVCLEHVGATREWAASEQDLLRRVAAETSLAIARLDALRPRTGPGEA